jgi:hypothetical protein
MSSDVILSPGKSIEKTDLFMTLVVALELENAYITKPSISDGMMKRSK